MRLVTHEGPFSDPATSADIVRAVASLTAVGRAYIILNVGPDEVQTYLQAAGSVEEDGFIVERRDGCAGAHYRGDRRVTADELVALLTSYLHQDPVWHRAITWHRVDLDQEGRAANANA